MAELKTKKTKASVAAFIEKVPDATKRKDAKELLKIFKDITGEKPAMWGQSIIGFGQYHYKSERSAQEGDWPIAAFSPRKDALTLYVMMGFKETLLKKLGKHKRSKGCLYIKRLSDIHLPTLKKIISENVSVMRKKYPGS